MPLFTVYLQQFPACAEGGISLYLNLPLNRHLPQQREVSKKEQALQDTSSYSVDSIDPLLAAEGDVSLYLNLPLNRHLPQQREVSKNNRPCKTHHLIA